MSKYRRKFQWAVEGIFPAGSFKQILLHSSSRPCDGNLMMSFYDDEQDNLKDLYVVMQEFVNYDIATKEWVCNMGSITLSLLDGKHEPFEKHIVENIGLASCCWAELDFSASEPLYVEATWRYQKCTRLDLSLPTSNQTTENSLMSYKSTQISVCTKPEMNIITRMI